MIARTTLPTSVLHAFVGRSLRKFSMRTCGGAWPRNRPPRSSPRASITFVLCLRVELRSNLGPSLSAWHLSEIRELDDRAKPLADPGAFILALFHEEWGSSSFDGSPIRIGFADDAQR